MGRLPRGRFHPLRGEGEGECVCVGTVGQQSGCKVNKLARKILNFYFYLCTCAHVSLYVCVHMQMLNDYGDQNAVRVSGVGVIGGCVNHYTWE